MSAPEPPPPIANSGDQETKDVERNSDLIDGHLAACPNTPNCVSSEGSAGNSYVAPLAFSGLGSKVWQALQDVIVEMGGRIEEVDDHFLHATFRSRLFRFVDDVSCRLDDTTHSIHIRSAARFGYFDFDVNRKRVEKLRKRLQTQDPG